MPGSLIAQVFLDIGVQLIGEGILEGLSNRTGRTILRCLRIDPDRFKTARTRPTKEKQPLTNRQRRRLRRKQKRHPHGTSQQSARHAHIDQISMIGLAFWLLVIIITITLAVYLWPDSAAITNESTTP